MTFSGMRSEPPDISQELTGDFAARRGEANPFASTTATPLASLN